MPLHLVQNQKKGYNLIHDGYIYRYYRQSTDHHIWRCIYYGTGKCRSSCKTTTKDEDGNVIDKIDHKHAPEPAKVEVMAAMEKLRNTAQHSKEPTGTIVSASVANVSVAASGELASRRDLSRTVNRIRNVSQNMPANPTTAAELVVPQEYCITKSNELFLQRDVKVITAKRSDRLLIFTTNNNMNLLWSSRVMYADGTFNTVPNIFYQMYSIHGAVEGKVLPLVFALTTGKTRKIYSTLLDELKAIEPRFQPEVVMADYERAFITASAKKFPNAIIKGCFFHFTQCVWKQIQACGLQGNYGNDAEYALNIRLLCALAFVPPDDVVEAYEKLIATPFYVDHAQELDRLLAYFEETWIGSPNRRQQRTGALYSILSWNHYDTTLQHEDRTNNKVEGWHSGFNNRAQAAHVSVWKFIELLQEEQVLTDRKVEKLLAGNDGNRSKRRYRDREQKIFKIVGQYEKRKNEIIDYLRGIAHNLIM